jgi:hypothetical protein
MVGRESRRRPAPRGNFRVPLTLTSCVHYLRASKNGGAAGRSSRAAKRQEEFTMTGKYGYLAVVLVSAAAVAVFASQLGGVLDFPSAQPRALTVFHMQEGLAVVPAQ